MKTFCLKCCSHPLGRSRYDRPKHCKFPVIIVNGRCDRSGRRAKRPAGHRTIDSYPISRRGAASPAARRSHRLHAAAARDPERRGQRGAHRRDGERRRALRRSTRSERACGVVARVSFADAHAASGQLEHGWRRRLGRRPRHRIWTPRGCLGACRPRARDRLRHGGRVRIGAARRGPVPVRADGRQRVHACRGRRILERDLRRRAGLLDPEHADERRARHRAGDRARGRLYRCGNPARAAGAHAGVRHRTDPGPGNYRRRHCDGGLLHRLVAGARLVPDIRAHRGHLLAAGRPARLASVPRNPAGRALRCRSSPFSTT